MRVERMPTWLSAFIRFVQSSGSRGGLGRRLGKARLAAENPLRKSQAGDVLSVEVNGYYKFNYYVIGYPFTS